jgi:hypothetical protein
MKTYYWFFLVIAILMYNGILAKRDKEMFKAYDKICAELPSPHPNCRYAK